MRLLEEQRGTPLYVRRGKGIALTPAGRALLPYACNVSQALTRARDALTGDSPPGQTSLRIGLSHHLIARFTGPLLRATGAYNDEGYLLRLHLLEGYTPELANAIRAGRLEAAYVLGTEADLHDLDVKLIGEEALVLFVRDDDPLGRHSSLPVTALEGETLVVPSSASSVYLLVTEALSRSGVRPGRVLEVSGPVAVRSAVHDGLGIGVSIGSFVERESRAGTFRTVALGEGRVSVPVRLLARDERFLLPDQQHALSYVSSRLG